MATKEIYFIEKYFKEIDEKEDDWDWDDFSQAFINIFYPKYKDSINEMPSAFIKNIIKVLSNE
jgi:hypothetical protein